MSLNSTQLKKLTVSLSLNASDGFPYMLTTGFDDNHDGLLNDRPPGVGIWSLRTTPVRTVSGRFTYNLPLGAPSGQAGGAAAQRYKLSIYANVNNLTNHANLSGFSGVMTSPFFMSPTSVQNPRKVDMGMNISF